MRQRTGSTPRQEIAWSRLRWPDGSVLGRLAPGDLRTIMQVGVYREYAPEDIIIREDDETDFVVLLLRGWAKVTAAMDSGGVALLAIRRGGDLVGELAGLDAEPRSATITAAGVVIAKMIKSEDFLAMLHREPGIHRAVSSTIGAKLRSATRRHVEFGGSSVAVRVARVLYELQRLYGEEMPGGARSVGISLTQPELAGLVGAAEPTVHKSLRDLRARGVISTGYRSLVINDLDELAAAANLPTKDTGRD